MLDQPAHTPAPAPTRVLVADDDPVSKQVLHATLLKKGCEVDVATDGAEAWRLLEGDDQPRIVLLDWMMPKMDGAEVCRRLRQSPRRSYTYVIMVTARAEKADVVSALDNGADDYITKPFHIAEVHARLRAGERILKLESQLQQKIGELQSALDKIEKLEGILPICMDCKKIRNDENNWQSVESYIAQRSAARFSHGLCNSCFEKRAGE